MSTDQDVVIAFQALAARHAKPEKSKKQYKYQLIPFAELRPGTRSSYLIEGVIPEAGLVAIYGSPKSGKSFWVFDLTMHIAQGLPYRGRRVMQGPVAYLAFEGAEGFKARAEAYRRRHEVDDKVPFFLLPSNAKLVRDHKALIECIDGQIDAPPVAVVLDTLNRSIDGSESKDVDMTAYISAAEVIVQEFWCAVLIVHHSGVDAKRPRGHTSLTGAVDCQIGVRRDAARNIIAEVEAAKDGPEGASFTSALEVVEVGTDDHGEPITSCVIVPAEGGTNQEQGQAVAQERASAPSPQRVPARPWNPYSGLNANSGRRHHRRAGTMARPAAQERDHQPGWQLPPGIPTHPGQAHACRSDWYLGRPGLDSIASHPTL
jgi:hypothetical protein